MAGNHLFVEVFGSDRLFIGTDRNRRSNDDGQCSGVRRDWVRGILEIIR